MTFFSQLEQNVEQNLVKWFISEKKKLHKRIELGVVNRLFAAKVELVFKSCSMYWAAPVHVLRFGQAVPPAWILPLSTSGVSHCGLAIYIKKYLKAEEELWKLKYFTMQKYNLPKKSSKRNQNPSRYYNSKTNLKFQHKPKYHLSKILI